ncbi:Lrp/AsnC family transcriptional regulator [Cucumibacter marinus]|uniref:Lrp/AsnC family transcriptional regulator n=1 Tax=Cucumibacter marinus TaxID=1121252 RepID=UPI00041022EE|nr:Lrp/AsnC family transcriptional regulator [Cucumibacter marinus]
MSTTESDQALIAILRENARLSTAEIARRLGLSRTTVQSRIDRLEEKGVIAGYTLRLSEDYLTQAVRAHLLVTVAPKLAAKVEAGLRQLNGVRTLHSVSGSFDMIVIVEAQSIQALDELIDRVGLLEGVERTLSSIILSTRIDR